MKANFQSLIRLCTQFSNTTLMVKNPTMSFPRKRESKLALYLQSILIKF